MKRFAVLYLCTLMSLARAAAADDAGSALPQDSYSSTLEVTVVGADNKPIPGVRLKVKPQHGTSTISDASNSKGLVTVKGFSPFSGAVDVKEDSASAGPGQTIIWKLRDKYQLKRSARVSQIQPIPQGQSTTIVSDSCGAHNCVCCNNCDPCGCQESIPCCTCFASPFESQATAYFEPSYTQSYSPLIYQQSPPAEYYLPVADSGNGTFFEW